MSAEASFLAIKPLSVRTTRAATADAVILNVMKHNHREIQAEFGGRADSKIDHARTCRNVILDGEDTAIGVAAAALEFMRDHGIEKTRKNATLGIEIVVSLPAGTSIDCLEYFRHAMLWAREYFKVPMVSAVIHQDESCPHAHFVLIPAREGRLIGSKLLGDRTATKALHASFHIQVSRFFGLRPPSCKQRPGAAARKLALGLAFEALKIHGGLSDSIISTLLKPHASDPEPLLSSLGIQMPNVEPKARETFAEIMTRPCKRESPTRTFGEPFSREDWSHQHAINSSENESPISVLGHSVIGPSDNIVSVEARNALHASDTGEVTQTSEACDIAQAYENGRSSGDVGSGKPSSLDTASESAPAGDWRHVATNKKNSPRMTLAKRAVALDRGNHLGCRCSVEASFQYCELVRPSTRDPPGAELNVNCMLEWMRWRAGNEVDSSPASSRKLPRSFDIGRCLLAIFLGKAWHISYIPRCLRTKVCFMESVLEVSDWNRGKVGICSTSVGRWINVSTKEVSNFLTPYTRGNLDASPSYRAASFLRACAKRPTHTTRGYNLVSLLRAISGARVAMEFRSRGTLRNLPSLFAVGSPGSRR